MKYESRSQAEFRSAIEVRFVLIGTVAGAARPVFDLLAERGEHRLPPLFERGPAAQHEFEGSVANR
ncbi:hypothetical protein QF000_008058 [Paraburkholderia atlantica]|uniref:hypothetical protein n=1 Tax=Paraburkholderia atlantica TaxID=2654982 RepID=UPI003D24F641